MAFLRTGSLLTAAAVLLCGSLTASGIGQTTSRAATPQPVQAKSSVHRRPMFGAQPARKIPQERDRSRAIPEDRLTRYRPAAALPPVVLPLANFQGNATAIIASAANGLVLARQSDCSIAAGNVPYSGNTSDPYGTPDSETKHYDQVLHAAAGLTSVGGQFNGKCADPTIGTSSSSLLYAGVSTGGMRMAAIAVYNSAADANVLDTFVIKSDGTFVSSLQQPIPATNQPYGIVAADLNGDGNPDLVVVGWIGSTSTAPSQSAVTILLGKADGTFTVGATYVLATGILSDSAVIDDFDGDGKLDIVIPVGGVNPYFAGNLTFLPGKGDGTFGTAKTIALSGVEDGLISADFNGDGKKDLVGNGGVVFLGKGDGTFTALPRLTAFDILNATSNEGTQLAAGDFNKDGKLDFAAGTGNSISIFLGNGDGTFTLGNTYASIENHGHVMATDLDGDGVLDIYSGNAQAGIFSGDDFTPDQGYALMGNGGATFAGAPEVPYANFLKLQDLNGDGKLDFIGITPDTSNVYNSTYATYYGNGDGTFRQAAPALSGSSFTYQGTQYQVIAQDSFTTGDINGDGHPDLIYLPQQYINQNPTRSGFVTAIANADGSFQTPQFFPAPAFGTDGAFEGLPVLSGLQGLTNQAGKFEILYGFAESYLPAGASAVTYVAGYATQVSNGDGTFASPALTVLTTSSTTPDQPLPPSAPINVADLNGDKIPDMVLYNYAIYTNVNGTPTITTPSSLQVMLGKADGTFAAATNISLIANPTPNPIAVGDINGDGIPDIITEGETFSGSNITYMLGVGLGKGDGTFQALTPVQLGGFVQDESFAIGDFDNDGVVDLAMVGDVSGIFPGNGDGTFKSNPSGYESGGVLPTLTIELQGGTFTIAGAYDVNGDGKTDLVAGNTIFLQTGATTTPPTLNSSSTALMGSASSITVGQTLTLNAVVTPASGAGTPTGSVTFNDGPASLSSAMLDTSGKAALSTAILAVGSHSITASYGGDASFSSSVSAAFTVTVASAPSTPATSTTTLTASASPVTAGQSVTLTATVAGPSGNTAIPTGTVSFLNGSTSIGSGVLDGTGKATLTTTVLPSGIDTITASYAGTASFAASVSNGVVVTVTAVATPDFAVSLSPASATVANGKAATTTVSITPSGGFNQAVTFACTGLPSGATCSFSPSTVTPTGTTAVTTALTIATSAASAQLLPVENSPRGGRGIISWAVVMFGLGGLAGLRQRFSKSIRGRQTPFVGVALLTVATLIGCGGGSSKKPTNSTVTVTATSGSEVHSATFSLTVQ
ncbi:uncharacterized protein (DUF2141 family) [Granulicella aggregans]|uniref:Uncharacterized protein (DUF2141 family) n=1 Tax=Granulicella aggregans TaxID=474949 RepID=A0A7W7ZFV1_9BACT|nr:FG-GAP-like repeat-containing protein [Granulicella aggregans]MBB5059108.1 uncharacterized protein (DUF2141 family) [Granulicella aggregans]